jgi:hypothetical protein
VWTDVFFLRRRSGQRDANNAAISNKVKVNFPLEQAMKVQREITGITLLFL